MGRIFELLHAQTIVLVVYIVKIFLQESAKVQEVT